MASSVAPCGPTTFLSAQIQKPLSKTLTEPTALLCFRAHQNPTTTVVSSSPSFPSPSLSRTKSSPLHIRYSSSTPLYPDEPAPSKTLKSRLSSGETLYGLFLLSSSPTLAEIAGLAGYDYVVVDMEHGQGGISDALPCLRALAAAGTPAVLRLPESSATWAKKALDLGPQGIMFPMIDTIGSAEEAVSYCRFPPRGVRGSAHPVVRASKYGIDEGYLEHYEEELLVMCQVETGRGVEEIEGIAAVDGVDCVQMGPLDLSASLGYLWEPGHKKVRAVMREAERKVLAAGGGAYLGGFAMPHDRPEEMKARGYHMVAGAVDLGMFRKAAVEDVLRFKMAAGASEEGDAAEGKDEEDDKPYWSE